jgi:radical SAM protein with 4Fe4S-binding SPASM domain
MTLPGGSRYEQLKDDIRSILEEKISRKRIGLDALLERLKENPRYILERSEYRPRLAVWEMTLACNMNCAHCGSLAGKPRPDELTTEEGLRLCDELIELGCERMTLLGGEPFLRKDWEIFARRLSEGGVRVNAISNGWIMADSRMADRVAESPLVNLGISIDGMEESHDKIRRRPGSFRRITKAMELMRERGVPVAVVSVVTTDSIRELEDLYRFIVDMGANRWQPQIAIPRGAVDLDGPWMIRPEGMRGLADFLIEKLREGKIKIDVGDNIGYMSSQEEDLRGGPNRNIPFWTGCYAGCKVIGIDSDGGIKGCLSIPSAPEFMEGNIRERPLREIWFRKGGFSYNREFSVDKLRGSCRDCPYGAVCRAGCTSMAYGCTGSPFENPYCLYRVEMLEEEREGGA